MGKYDKYLLNTKLDDEVMLGSLAPRIGQNNKYGHKTTVAYHAMDINTKVAQLLVENAGELDGNKEWANSEKRCNDIQRAVIRDIIKNGQELELQGKSISAVCNDEMKKIRDLWMQDQEVTITAAVRANDHLGANEFLNKAIENAINRDAQLHKTNRYQVKYDVVEQYIQAVINDPKNKDSDGKLKEEIYETTRKVLEAQMKQDVTAVERTWIDRINIGEQEKSDDSAAGVILDEALKAHGVKANRGLLRMIKSRFDKGNQEKARKMIDAFEERQGTFSTLFTRCNKTPKDQGVSR